MAEGGVREHRRGRRWAMKALYMWDARGGGAPEALVEEARRMEAAPGAMEEGTADAQPEREAGREAAARFARALTAGAIERVAVIDGLLDSLAPAWGPSRMAAVDRAVLRLGCYELMYGDTPEGVAVSEAVELARAYSTADSPRFVNGVLGAVAPRRPARAGAPEARHARAPGAPGATDKPPTLARRGEPG